MSLPAEQVGRRQVRGVRSAAGVAVGGVVSVLIRPLRLRQHQPRPIDDEGTPPAWQGPWPSISMAMPTLNQGVFIERALRSITDQRYPHLEIVVQDGGSTDGTLEVLDRWRDRVTAVASEPDDGQADAINRAFTRTSGEIMGWLNSDDALLPGALAHVGAFFAQHPEVDAVYGWRIVIDDADRHVGRWTVPANTHDYLPWADYVPQETLFWRRELWERVGGRLDAELSFALDWDLLLRFREAGAAFACLPVYLGAFRLHSDSKTVGLLDYVGQADMTRLRERHHGRALPHWEVTRALLPLYARAWVVRARVTARGR